MRNFIANKLKDPTLRDAAFTFTVRVGSAGLAYGIQVFLARLLELQEYGIYAALWTWTIVAAHMAVGGFSESSLRFLPRYMARDRVNYARGFLSTGFAIVAIVSTAFMCLGSVAIWLLSPVISPPYLAGLIVVTLGLPLAAMEMYMEGVCRSFGWYGLAIIPSYLVRPLLIGLGVAVWFFAGYTPDAAFVLILALVITGFLALYQACVMYSRLAKMAGVERGKRRTGLWLRASLPLLLVNGIEEIFISSDVLLLGLMGSPDQVALYFAAARSMALVNFVYYAFMIVGPRKFSLDNAGQDRNKLQQGITETTWWTFWLTVPAVAVTLMAGYPLLMLFGPDFVAAYPVMVIIALGYLARASVGPTTDLLVVLGYQRASLLISAGCLLANICLTITFFPIFGINGVALATSCALMIRAAALASVAKRHAGLNVFVCGFRPPRAELSAGAA